MSKTKAAARKKARLAKQHAAMAQPRDPNAPEKKVVESNQHAPKFDPKSSHGGGVRLTGGRGHHNTANTRGAARSK